MFHIILGLILVTPPELVKMPHSPTDPPVKVNAADQTKMLGAISRDLEEQPSSWNSADFSAASRGETKPKGNRATR